MESEVDTRPDKRFDNGRAVLVMKAEHDLAAFEQLKGLRHIPRWVSEFHDVQDSRAARYARQRAEKIVEARKVDMKTPRQLIQHRAELAAERCGAPRLVVPARAPDPRPCHRCHPCRSPIRHG